MKSFRDGIENLRSTGSLALVEKDILELGQKIQAYRNGNLEEDKFKSLRLARGVYGQRQQGVQMLRIKFPFGAISPEQLVRVADISEHYTNGNLHLTTRQDIQLHHISLDDTPKIWEELEKDEITLREACGNTVRNVTASPMAGIDPEEPFDVSPYADLVFRYFLRKPFCQELGRKIKIAFSASEKDDAFAFIHDFGFIPKLSDGRKGFKVLVGGGLGAQPFLAQTAYAFLPEHELIPFIEAGLRVFDRYGERNSRHKARIKYLISKIGVDGFLSLVEAEKSAVQCTNDDIQLRTFNYPEGKEHFENWKIFDHPNEAYQLWLKTNVKPQKQRGLFAVFCPIQLGNLSANRAREIADLMFDFQLNEARITINQSIQLRHIQGSDLPMLYAQLLVLGLVIPGYNSVADVTACPGTDTCNLGISNSTNVAVVIEQFIREQYPHLLLDDHFKIKISGCMNSCGQHGLAHLGLHGSSIKTKLGTIPALQVLLGGGQLHDGFGRIAEKVIKVPSKRILQVIDLLLNDFQLNAQGIDFHQYYDQKGNRYFYDLLKPLADTQELNPSDYIDWGQEQPFQTAIGVGECAGVVIDLVGTLYRDALEKWNAAKDALSDHRWADAAYFAYATNIHLAKSALIDSGIHCNTHHGIIKDFDLWLINHSVSVKTSFSDFVLRINQVAPSEQFALQYLEKTEEWLQIVQQLIPKLKNL
jgi:sulfite reductase (ferredoxin)